MTGTHKTLVLGGSYFIGRRSVELLRDAGHDVSVLNRGSREPPSGVTQLTADRNDPVALGAAVRGQHFDVVVDFSCYDAVQARLALDALGGRFRHWIHISSAAVYSDTERVPVVETSPLGGLAAWGAYGREKSEAEQQLRASEHSSRITILRPPYLYGPGNNLDRERFLWQRLLRGRPLLVPGSGESVIQFLHVDDLGRAVLALLGRPSLSLGKSYNVGDLHATTIKGWIHAAARAAGVAAQIVEVPTGTLGLSARSYFPLRDLSLFVDPRCLQLELGFRPHFELSSGLAQTLASYDRRALAEAELELTNEDRVLAELGEHERAGTYSDVAAMRRAITLARRQLGTTGANPAVGCVLTKDGSFVGEGVTGAGGRPHGEESALASVAATSARGATAFITLEPCGERSVGGLSCAERLVNAAVARVVVATSDASLLAAGRGLARLREAGITVELGLLAEEAQPLYAGYLPRSDLSAQ